MLPNRLWPYLTLSVIHNLILIRTNTVINICQQVLYPTWGWRVQVGLLMYMMRKHIYFTSNLQNPITSCPSNASGGKVGERFCRATLSNGENTFERHNQRRSMDSLPFGKHIIVDMIWYGKSPIYERASFTGWIYPHRLDAVTDRLFYAVTVLQN